jgi:hypothetical protein
MVRRWSHINFINCGPLVALQSVPKASVDANMNTLMYLKKRYTPSTKLTRKQWARRKHVHNWLAPMNILKDWAKVYRFHRNHSKVVYYQFFTKNSFIAFSLVSAQSSIPSLYKGSEDVITGMYTKRLLRFFKRYPNPRLSFLYSNKCARVLLVSCYLKADSSDMTSIFESNKSLVPLYYDHLTYASHWDSTSEPLSETLPSLLRLFDHLFHLFLFSALAAYRVLVLTSLLQFKQSH